VVNTYHLPQKVERFFKDLRPQWKHLSFSHEQDLLLGSGGGIHKAKKFLQDDGDFFVINGDEVILPHQMKPLEDMLAFHRWHKGIATLLTMKHPEVGSKFGGAWLGSEGTKIECFSKTNPGAQAPRGLHFLGVLLLSPKIFTYFKQNVEVENILYETLTSAMAAGEEVHAYECQAEWFETGNPVDFMKATEYCMDQLNQPMQDRPYWQEHLMRTIRMYSENRYILEKDSPRFSELQNLIQKVRKGF
jgi:mannose-1-phosphate guanylyltransferase